MECLASSSTDKSYSCRFLILLLCLFPASFSLSQTILLREAFDDGDLSRSPLWTKFFSSELIGIDSTAYHSAPYSCKIATVNQLSAIETSTRIYSSTLPFEITEYVYVESMGDEAIPLFLRGQATVLVLFLLPNGLVQLDVLKETSQWVTAQVRIPGGYGIKRWHSIKITFDGLKKTSLYIDSVYRGSVDQQLVDIPHTLQLGNKYLPHTSTFYADDILVTTSAALSNPAKVYLVLCSDTGTWDGLDVNRAKNYLQFGVYSSPSGNAAKVINLDFRNRIRDSNNRPLVFTWFMLDGSMAATNTNPEVRYPWISNLEMIQKYHGENLKSLGDELSFHYHTWIWNDPDQNGVFHWNQASQFSEYRENFVETLGHIVIEGKLLPTSFRSGWHYMDNQWEALIDGIIPYRFENTSPARAVDTVEPLDNNYDWSRASLEWVPYHPDATDYQSKGNLKGWETRCLYMKQVTIERMQDVFSKAFRGEDQLMAIWSHLPETDFPQQIIGVDSVVRLAKEYFPEVNYDYVTATESMKKWRGLHQDDPLMLRWSTQVNVDTVSIIIESSAPLWQVAPLVFARDAKNKVLQLTPQAIAYDTWKVTFDKRLKDYQTIGIAGTDTAGNASVQVISLIPTAVEAAGGEDVSGLKLYDAYPNPFNPTTKIEFVVPVSGSVQLVVQSVLGQQVSVLLDDFVSPGKHSVVFDGRNLASGMYFYMLKAGDKVLRNKMVLLK